MSENTRPHSRDTPTVFILMATFNGGLHIGAQLESIASQTFSNWSLWISDDGSHDTTIAQIKAFSKANPDHDIRLFQGPQKGPAQNFLSLLSHPDLPSGPVAFADQDDVWFDDKLARAVLELSKHPQDQAVAYSCADIATDSSLKPLNQRSRRIEFASFPNALIQNVMRGNSIVLNTKATEVLRSTAVPATAGTGVAFHDWWAYVVLSGAAARIVIDPKPGLLYRQHGTNAMGANVGLRSLVIRFKLLRSRQHQNWISSNLKALGEVSEILTVESKSQLAEFQEIRKMRGYRGFRGFLKSGMKRQTKTGTAIMAILAFFGRL